MMMEYRIANKVEGLFIPRDEQEMHCVLVYTGTGNIVSVSKEMGWSKNAVSISVIDTANSKIRNKATFKDRAQLETLIKALENYKDFLVD
jgi:hypothetical protein